MDIQNQISAGYLENNKTKVSALAARFPGEIVRKSLHLLIALIPPIAMLNLPFAISLLAAGTLFYAFAEVLRREGRSVLLVSDLTLIASRDKDMGTFVLGPVTLGIGTMLALMLYPRPAASIAIYALAFGDGFASLVGKTIGGLKIPFLRGKTFSGTTACFAAVFLVTLKITARPLESLAIGLIAALLEAAPLGDYDNIVIPVGVGLAATQLLYS